MVNVRGDVVPTEGRIDASLATDFPARSRCPRTLSHAIALSLSLDGEDVKAQRRYRR